MKRKCLGEAARLNAAARRMLRFAAFHAPLARGRRTHPCISINLRRAIHTLDSANNVTSCAVFFAKPR